VELLLIGAALGLTGVVWVSRARAARRFNAALDAYAEREIGREWRRDGRHRVHGVGMPEGASPIGSIRGR
jgi:hypothetical protein